MSVRSITLKHDRILRPHESEGNKIRGARRPPYKTSYANFVIYSRVLVFQYTAILSQPIQKDKYRFLEDIIFQQLHQIA